MAINITDSGSTVKLEVTADYGPTPYNQVKIPAQVRFIPKDNLTVEAIGEYVVLYDSGDPLAFKFQDITNPSSGSAADKAAVIEAFADSTASGFLWDDSPGYEAYSISKNSAGKFFSISGYSSKTSSQFIQVHNASSLPAEGAVPVLFIPVAAQSGFFIEDLDGKDFPLGIVWCCSSTGPTKTLGTIDCFANLKYQ